MATAKVGPKGQIVIPKEIRDMFNIVPGDNLVVMADSSRGIAIVRQNFLTKLADAIFAGHASEEYPGWTDENAEIFASEIKKTGGGIEIVCCKNSCSFKALRQQMRRGQAGS